jgi:hypothetical protein
MFNSEFLYDWFISVVAGVMIGQALRGFIDHDEFLIHFIMLMLGIVTLVVVALRIKSRM